jgi:hypothetical protein
MKGWRISHQIHCRQPGATHLREISFQESRSWRIRFPNAAWRDCSLRSLPLASCFWFCPERYWAFGTW